MEVNRDQPRHPAVGVEAKLARADLRQRQARHRTASVVGPDALRAYPVKFDENGKLAKPPVDSKHHGADLTEATKAKPYRRRRSSAQLKAEVIDLHKRGLVPLAISNQLNVSDRRIKAILAEAA